MKRLAHSIHALATIATVLTIAAALPAEAGGGGAGKVKYDRLTLKKFSDSIVVPLPPATLATGN